jgi:Fe-S-cluster containining protein
MAGAMLHGTEYEKDIEVDKNGCCVNLLELDDGTYECGIYDTRPDICRVDVMAKKSGMIKRDYYKLTDNYCEVLRNVVSQI